MKLKTLSGIALVLTVASFHYFEGCTRVPNPEIAYPPVPAPQVIWSNGSPCSWFGNALTPQSPPNCPVTPATITGPDPISGDSNVLYLPQVSPVNFCGIYKITSTVAVLPSSYYSGHLQFDIQLGQPAVNYSAVTISFWNSTLSDSWAYAFPPPTLNNLSNTTFTHISIPITSFTTSIGSAYLGGVPIDIPFQINWITTVLGESITLDNLIWTAN